MYEASQKDFESHGIIAKDVTVDVAKMMNQKNTAVTQLTGGIEGLFKKNKVTYVKGYGTLTGPNSVSVKLNDGGEEVIEATNIVVAAGSEPIELPFMKYDEKRVLSNTGVLDLDAIPKKLVVIGAGVIGLEMGSVWRRLGAQVDVVEFLPRIVPGTDMEIATAFQKILKKQGMNFHLNTKVTGCEVKSDGVVLSVEGKKGPSTLEADAVLVAVGRRPRTENMGLEEIGVELSANKQIVIGENFRTNIPSVFAIGDCVRGPMLAHKAEDEGIAVMEYLAKGHCHVNYEAIPNVIYTHPEIATVGKSEEELKEAGIEYNKGVFPFLANSRAKTNGDTDGMIKFLSDKKTDRILGVHMLGAQAGEQIAEAVLAMEYGASAEDVGRTCHAHPTLSEAVKEAAMACYDKPIHF
jgi:dihydrolipoamide dehydrogenase